MVLFLYTSWSPHRLHGTGRMRAFGSQGHAPSALSPCLSVFIQKQMSGRRRVAGLLFRQTVQLLRAEGPWGQGSGWLSRRHSVLGDFYFCFGWGVVWCGVVEFCGLAALSLLLVCFLETILDDLQPFCSVTLICYISIQQTHYEKKILIC